MLNFFQTDTRSVQSLNYGYSPILDLLIGWSSRNVKYKIEYFDADIIREKLKDMYGESFIGFEFYGCNFKNFSCPYMGLIIAEGDMDSKEYRFVENGPVFIYGDRPYYMIFRKFLPRELTKDEYIELLTDIIYNIGDIINQDHLVTKPFLSYISNYSHMSRISEHNNRIDPYNLYLITFPLVAVYKWMEKCNPIVANRADIFFEVFDQHFYRYNSFYHFGKMYRYYTLTVCYKCLSDSDRWKKTSQPYTFEEIMKAFIFNGYYPLLERYQNFYQEMKMYDMVDDIYDVDAITSNLDKFYNLVNKLLTAIEYKDNKSEVELTKELNDNFVKEEFRKKPDDGDAEDVPEQSDTTAPDLNTET